MLPSNEELHYLGYDDGFDIYVNKSNDSAFITIDVNKEKYLGEYQEKNINEIDTLQNRKSVV